MKRPGIYNRPRIGLSWLLAATLVLLAGFGWAHWGGGTEKNPWFAQQLGAARRTQEAHRVLRDYMQQAGIPMEVEDVNRTGLIGPQISVLTTSLGLLEAKRTSLNPDMAALMVTFFQRAGLKAGDRVALGISGSFPGLAIAALSAATEMGLHAKCIVSYGSSNYGATRPELTIPRMLRLLEEAGLLACELLAVSPGGGNDTGGDGLFEETREVILRLAREEGVPVIHQERLEQSILERLTLYGDDIACFVNIGGAAANMGDGMHSLDIPPGLSMEMAPIPDSPTRGLMYEYAARGVPVVHLLNMRQLALDNGLPFDPVPLPQPGLGAVYHRRARQPAVVLGAIAAALGLLVAGHRAHGRRRMAEAAAEGEGAPAA